MRESSFVIATCIMIIFVIIKLLHTKFIIKEDIVLKKIITDSIFVYICVIIGVFIIDQVNDRVDAKTTFAFTSTPDF